MNLDIQRIRADFPALQQRFDGRPVVYLDNACMTAKPRQVLQAMERYYTEFPGCHGRAAHTFGRRTTDAYEGARAAIARLIGAPPEARQLVFTKNSTEGINLVMAGLPWREGDVVLTSEMEHNSNHLPWLHAGQRHGIKLRHFALADDGTFDEERFVAALGPEVKLVSVFQTSNVTGVSLPVERIVELSHAQGALVLVDASQAVGSGGVDVGRTGCDFLVLSMHKVMGPTGVGVLYGTAERLAALRPLLYGGEMVADVQYRDFSLAGVPDRFEAGLQNYAGVIGAGAAADYLRALSPEAVTAHLARLNRIAGEGLRRIKGVTILGPEDPALRHGVVNFVLQGTPSEHLAQILDQSRKIMVRAGVHCVHSWYHARGLQRSVRASFYLYNTEQEAELLVKSVRELSIFF